MRSGTLVMKIETAGCWSHLETSSFTGLAPGVTVKWVHAALSISSFHMLSSQGSGFLTAWQPQRSQTSYMAPKADVPANSKTKATWLFLILPQKSCGATFRVFTGYTDWSSDKPARIQREITTLPAIPMGEMSENLCFITLSSLIPKQ